MTEIQESWVVTKCGPVAWGLDRWLTIIHHKKPCHKRLLGASELKGCHDVNNKKGHKIYNEISGVSVGLFIKISSK